MKIQTYIKKQDKPVSLYLCNKDASPYISLGMQTNLGPYITTEACLLEIRKIDKSIYMNTYAQQREGRFTGARIWLPLYIK